MVNVFLPNGELDIYDGQSIDWTYTPIRFTDGLTEPYSTDFDIPNNRHNVSLLRACGLLDSDNRFGSRVEPANLDVNGVVVNVYIQVASISEDSITIALFEKSIPTDVLTKTLHDLVQDDQYSIYEWDANSDTRIPSVFKKYVYGPFRDFNYAMYHPSRNANDIIDVVSMASGYNLPHTDQEFWVTATGKTVCPQNQKQVIEVSFKDGSVAKVNGGQHVTNDLEWSWSPDGSIITFNRQCNVRMTIYVHYDAENHWGNDSYFETIIDRTDSTPTQAHPTLCETSVNANRSRIVTDTWTVPNNYIQEGSTMRFRFQDISHFHLVSAVVQLEISGYGITEDDYGKELQYIARKPKMEVRDYGSNTSRYITFDGTTQALITFQSDIQWFVAPYLTFSWIGFWCNLVKTELKDFLWGLAWMTGTKFQKRNWNYYFDPADDSYEIDGEITLFETTNDALGQRNHLVFTGEDDAADNTVSEIDNFWMDPDKDVHESPFAYSLKQYGNWAYFPQYSDNERDEEKDSYGCKYEDTDGMALSRISDLTPNLLLRLSIPDMGFDEVTEATTVEIETYDQVARADFVYLHGRKFMVQQIDTDITTGLSTVKAVEIWKRNPESQQDWPPVVQIDNIYNINAEGATVTFHITEQ